MESHHVILRRHDGFAAARRLFALSGLCVAACACDRANHTAREGESLGASVVENRALLPEWRVTPKPDLRIGAADGAPHYQFYRVRFAGKLQDGRIVVVDGGSGEIRWYGASGRHRASVGRRGAGPGEFRDIRSALLTSGDTVVVHDVRNQRITWLSPAEEIVRAEHVPGLGGSGVHLLAVRDSGRLVISQTQPVTAFGSSDFTYTRDSLTILLHSPAGLDTVVSFSGNEAVTWIQYVDGRPRGALSMELPFGFQVLPGATRQHIVLAVGERQQLELLNDSGELVRIAKRSDVERTSISAQDRGRYVDHITQEARSRGAPDLALVIRGARDRVALLPESREMPLFDRLLVDSEDRMWLRDYMPVWTAVDSPQLWTVYSASGTALARITTPAGVEIMHATRSHLTGVQRDESNVEYVNVYRFDGAR